MRSVSKNKAADWVRLAAKVGLLFTEPKVRAAVGDQLKDRMDDLTDAVTGKYNDVSDTVASKYDDVADRMSAAADAFRGRSFWSSPTAGFLLGVGVGAGLGILLAPTSGSEMRETVRDKATAVRGKFRDSISKMPATGTEG
jgi:gas vesicle protein